MKAAANGALNVSVLDGWWDEVWAQVEHSSGIGWAIGKGEVYEDVNNQDQVEAEALYDLLERDVVPAFYDRGTDRLPRKWIDRMKTSISSLCKFVNTHRMVSEYVCRVYLEAHDRFRALDADGAARTRALAAWLVRAGRDWPQVRIGHVAGNPVTTVPVGARAPVRVRVHLGSLSPDDVAVELYVGRLGAEEEIIDAEIIRMRAAGQDAHGDYLFCAEAACTRSGLQGFTVRVRATHVDLSTPLLPGLICWAEAAASA
jgi:starch phosphorylase